jgi:peptide deformylase
MTGRFGRRFGQSVKAALRELARDLLETMHAAPGIRITAPHIGISLRVVLLDLEPIDGARTYSIHLQR